jgi:protein-S-isoprenylcysteine O-methyltransferase Ste14
MRLSFESLSNTRAWDIATRVMGASWFVFFDAVAFSGLVTTARQLGAGQMDVATVAALAGQVCFFLLLLIETSLIVCRPRPIAKHKGVQARVSALLGTWLMVLVVLIPFRNDLPPSVYVAGAALGALGDLLAIYVVLHLGGSFSIMAEARVLVTRGPYGIVRHPLYLAEEIGLASAVITHLSGWAVSLLIIQAFFQCVRAHNEERVLARAFPAYVAYMHGTPMLLPRLRSQHKLT